MKNLTVKKIVPTNKIVDVVYEKHRSKVRLLKKELSAIKGEK